MTRQHEDIYHLYRKYIFKYYVVIIYNMHNCIFGSFFSRSAVILHDSFRRAARLLAKDHTTHWRASVPRVRKGCELRRDPRTQSEEDPAIPLDLYRHLYLLPPHGGRAFSCICPIHRQGVGLYGHRRPEHQENSIAAGG